MAKQYARTEFKLWLEIYDSQSKMLKTTFNDVVSISATFAMNAIPAATISVATGKNMNNEPAKIHDALKTLRPKDKAVVWCKVTSDDPDLEALVNASMFVLFDGYYMGLGYQRSFNSASYTLQLVHWLDDLNCSSMLNGNWHPGVPRDMAQAANNDVLVMRGGSNYAQIQPVVDTEHAVLTAENMKEDLWDKALKPIFTEIASLSHPKEQDAERTPAGEDDKNGNNAAAKAALARMPGDAPKPATLPMLLDDGIDNMALEEAAQKGVSLIASSNWAYSSFWSKLIGEFGPEFLFAISPGVTFANVIPFFGGLREPWRDIKGVDYSYANFNVSVQHLIESVEIRYPQRGSSNIWAAGEEENAPGISYYYPWGRFPADNTLFRGQIVIKEPPVWLSNAIPNGLYSPGTTGIGGDAPPGDTAATPAEASAVPSNNAPTPAEAEREIKDAHLLDLYCEHWYKSEVLAQRYGELSGKLRFDIAPGSMVRIEAPDTAIGAENATMYAAVVSVSFVIDAEKPAAGTSFTLISLRTDTENNNTDLTSARPPLYPNSTWTGGPLVREITK